MKNFGIEACPAGKDGISVLREVWSAMITLSDGTQFNVVERHRGELELMLQRPTGGLAVLPGAVNTITLKSSRPAVHSGSRRLKKEGA